MRWRAFMTRSAIALPRLRTNRAADVLPFVVLAVLIGILLAIGFSSNEHFGTATNLQNVLEQSSGLMLVSLGQTLVVLTGGIDLSVGSLISLLSEFLSGLING